jgi:ADP-heptose:LPS heptosyltransferase
MRILLVRLDGIGDALACAPLVAALRDAGHELGIALTRGNAAIFADDAFAWTHVLERRPWPAHGHAAEDVAAAVAQAREIGYELALVASEEPDAYDLGRAAAPRSVGFVNGWEKPLKTLQVRGKLDRAILRTASTARQREHEVETLFALGEGLTSESVPTAEVRRLRPLVVDAAPVDNAARVHAGRYIGLQLTTKWARLGIAHKQLAAWALQLREIAPLRLLASAEESAEVRGVGDLLGTDVERIHATIFDGREGMRAWKRAIADAAAIVTPDTGAAHVAGTIGTPCVDVFPGDRYAEIQIRRWRPWAAPSRTLIARGEIPVVAGARDLFEQACAPF